MSQHCRLGSKLDCRPALSKDDLESSECPPHQDVALPQMWFKRIFGPNADLARAPTEENRWRAAQICASDHICVRAKSACWLNLRACQICVLVKSAFLSNLRACHICRGACQICVLAKSACWSSLRACHICVLVKSAFCPNLRSRRICVPAKSAFLQNLLAGQVCVPATSACWSSLRSDQICVPAKSACCQICAVSISRPRTWYESYPLQG